MCIRDSVEGDAIYQTERIVRLNAQTLETETEFSCDELYIQGMGKAEDGTLLLISGEYRLRRDFDAGKLTAMLHWAGNANTSVNNYRSVMETESGFFAWNSDVEAAVSYTHLNDELIKFCRGTGLRRSELGSVLAP